jgi:hypothetical protein
MQYSGSSQASFYSPIHSQYNHGEIETVREQVYAAGTKGCWVRAHHLHIPLDAFSPSSRQPFFTAGLTLWKCLLHIKEDIDID